jgi:PGF-pre-PGF domain-containing protein
MTGTNVKVNETLANPLVRNVLHLISTIFIGYIVLRLLLYILDATHIGLGWLEANQGIGFFVIILILILSFLAIDAGISLGRRRLGDVRYSVVESGMSLAKAGIKKSHELPVKGKDKSGTGIPRAERPSGEPGGFGRKEPVIKETQNQKPEPAVKKEETRPAPVIEPTRPEVEKPLSYKEIIRELESDDVPEVKPEPAPSTVSSTVPVQEKPHVIPEKPVLPEDVIKKPVPYKEPESNIKLYESVSVLVKEGKRVIKAFDSQHSINVIDFRSKITKKDVKITIELLKEHSVMAGPVTKGLVYEYDNIELNLTDEDVDNAVIRFKIDWEWITQNKILNVQLEQFVNGKWDIIIIKEIGQDAEYLFYEANVPSLSMPFAIVGT